MNESFNIIVGIGTTVLVMMIIVTLVRPVPNLRLANEAALCDSYSRKQKPRFFFLSSGELYIITSIRPAIIVMEKWMERREIQLLVKENATTTTSYLDKDTMMTSSWFSSLFLHFYVPWFFFFSYISMMVVPCSCCSFLCMWLLWVVCFVDSCNFHKFCLFKNFESNYSNNKNNNKCVLCTLQ